MVCRQAVFRACPPALVVKSCGASLLNPNIRRFNLRELVRTNDPVLISFLEALLKSEGIGHVVLDQNMSILDGSLGILPRRVMVENGRHAMAVLLLKEAGLDAELSRGIGESPA